jgi:hypothetical protein
MLCVFKGLGANHEVDLQGQTDAEKAGIGLLPKHLLKCPFIRVLGAVRRSDFNALKKPLPFPEATSRRTSRENSQRAYRIAL